jgi:DHA2 family multidrug resistance protein
MFNMVKGLASAIAAAVIDVMMTRREHAHSNILLDQFGASRFVLDGFHYPYGGIAAFAQAVRGQAMILASADLYCVMTGLAGALLILVLLLPTRVYPPASASVAAPAGR